MPFSPGNNEAVKYLWTILFDNGIYDAEGELILRRKLQFNQKVDSARG